MADTTQMIVNRMKQLMKSKPVDKITVKELVEYCGISRQAFYYHFEGIVEVLQWMIQQEVKDALKETLDKNSVQECILLMVQRFTQHVPSILMMLDSKCKDVLEKELCMASREFFMEFLKAKNLIPAQESKEYLSLCEFYICGAAHLMMMYVADGTADSKDLADKLYKIYLTVFRDYLEV